MATKNEYTVEDAKRAVGPGWSKLIQDIYDFLPDDVEILQVKEKYGGLRFYIGSANKEVFDMISKKEEESLTICEECGDVGEVRRLLWVLTLCDKHYTQHLAYLGKQKRAL